jgi:hypothetical protein
LSRAGIFHLGEESTELTFRRRQVKTWLDHRINQQHVKVQLAGEIKVEGDTAMAEMVG